MTNYQILVTITNVILWCIIVVGTLGVLAGLLWCVDRLIPYIFKCVRLYPALVEFIWNRSKYKKLLREGDYEELPSKTKQEINKL
jgi:hypothetical protein